MSPYPETMDRRIKNTPRRSEWRIRRFRPFAFGPAPEEVAPLLFLG
jgi:hypothetical protein